jgi:hypothetical protein
VKNLTAATAVHVGNGPDEAAEVRLRLMATSFTTKKRIKDEHGEKIA